MVVETLIKNLFVENESVSPEKKYSYNEVETFVRETIKKRTSNSYEEKGKKIKDFYNDRNKRKILMKNLKRCGIGDLSAKLFMKDYIKDIVTQLYGVSEENINYSINFDNPGISQDKFEIVLLKYKEKHEFKAIGVLLEKYGLDQRREFSGERKYMITDDDISFIYKTENEKEKIILKFEEKLEILCQRLYQDIRGLSVIDETRDMDIDGISIGVSGIPQDFMGKLFDMELKSNQELIGRVNKYPLSYDSIWLYYKHKEIHLKFMSFGSFKEQERVCKTIYKFNNYKHFSRAAGYIFSTMADLSRVVVFRPPFSASWVAFIRKEDKKLFIEDFTNDKEIYFEDTKNSTLLKGIVKFSTMAKQKIYILGNQGLGKTALLKVLVEYIYPEITLRVWEDEFEAYLCFLYPERNIASIKTTSKINGEKGLDILKKSNGRMFLIPEAAEDIVISYLIKIGRISSESIICCHHATSDENLIEAMTSANINTGAITNEETAEAAAIKSLGFNYHMGKNENGQRCIAKVTQVIPVRTEFNSKFDFDKADTNEIMKYTFTLIAEHLKKKNMKKYEVRTIIEYDLEAKKYVVRNNISKEKIKEMKDNLYEEDKEEFLGLIDALENSVSPENKVEI